MLCGSLAFVLALWAAPAPVCAAERPPPPKAKAQDRKDPSKKEEPKDAKRDAAAKPATGKDEKEAAPNSTGATSAADATSPEATAETAPEGEAKLGLALSAASVQAWPDAARCAYGAVVNIPSTDEKHETAQLALGEALVQLGLTQPAAEYYFAVVEKRLSPGLLPRALAGLEKLSRRGVVAEEKLLRGVLVEADVANIPPDIADFLSYQRGLSNLRLGDRRWTAYDFASIRPETFYGHKARLAMIVAQVKDGALDEARTAVEALLEEKPDPELEAEARLIRARLLFEARKSKEAIEVYRGVKGTAAVPAGEALLERAWSHYQHGDYHDAMGLLYALGAPSHRGLFLPDQYVLRGLIYQRFCHFRAAKGAAADFHARYGAAIEALQEGVPPVQVPIVARAADELPEVAGMVRVRNALVSERKLLASQKGSLAEGGLAQHLDAVYSLLEARTADSYDVSASAAARLVAERLLEANEQADLLEYEVGVSIHRRVQDAAGKAYGREKAEAVPREGDKTYYHFDGEYWTDELPDMRFLIADRCVE